MNSKLKARIEGASIWVIFFGIFVIISLVLQCLIPFLKRIAEIYQYDGVLLIFINQNFNTPMSVICNFWAAISAAYIGVDRAAMTISTINGSYNKVDKGNPEHNRHIIIESFIVYSIAILLNMIFDVELAIEPLAISFCSSVLLYVSGQKAIYAASKIAPEDDKNMNGIPDDKEYILEKVKNLIIEKKEFIVAIRNKDGKFKTEIENKQEKDIV